MSDDLVVQTRTQEDDRWRRSPSCLAACSFLYITASTALSSTGTGSGKSLTYLIPIVDYVLRTNPEKHKVRAILVYPMNALINSQYRALETYAGNNPGIPIRFAQYTGQ